MSALTKERAQKPFFAKKIRLKMGAGFKAFKGGIACFDTSAPGYVVQGQVSTTLVRIGVFLQTVDNTAGGAGDQLVNVELDYEISGQWFANDTAHPVVAATIGLDVYVLDDHTVTSLATGASKAGRAWAIDSQLGVAVVPYAF